MSVNKFRDHMVVLPEDDATRQLVNGFCLHDRLDPRRVSVQPPSRGWSAAVDSFERVWIDYLRRYQRALFVFLIDFDGDPDARRDKVRAAVPTDLRDRVFVLGPRDNVEALRAASGTSPERLGSMLAAECFGDADLAAWLHEHVASNTPERERLAPLARSALLLDA
jgi:hypothetical protein